MNYNTAELMFKYAKKNQDKKLKQKIEQNRQDCVNRINANIEKGNYETECNLIQQSVDYFKNKHYDVTEIDPQCSTIYTHRVNWLDKK